MKLLLARHGQTEYNLQKRFYGASDSPLTPLGRQQAADLGQALQATQVQPDLIVSSSLSRTIETAEIVIAINGWQSIPVLQVSAFNEIDFGLWEGLTADEIEEQDPVTWQAYLDQPLDTAFPQGESYPDFRQRILQVYQTLPWQETNLVIGHLGVLRSLVTTLELSPLDYWDLTFPQGHYREFNLD